MNIKIDSSLSYFNEAINKKKSMLFFNQYFDQFFYKS